MFLCSRNLSAKYEDVLFAMVGCGCFSVLQQILLIADTIQNVAMIHNAKRIEKSVASTTTIAGCGLDPMMMNPINGNITGVFCKIFLKPA